MADVGLVIMLEESHRADIDRMAKSLEAQGLRVEQKLARFRTIIGSGDPSLVNRLKGMEGVQTVRPQHSVQLPPMDDDVPQ
jgi:hypothetical protein